MYTISYVFIYHFLHKANTACGQACNLGLGEGYRMSRKRAFTLKRDFPK